MHIIRDLNGIPCKVGDIVYDNIGNKNIIVSLRQYVKPKNWFERFVSIGKEGYKIVLKYISPEKDFVDFVYLDELEFSNMFSHIKRERKKLFGIW